MTPNAKLSSSVWGIIGIALLCTQCSIDPEITSIDPQALIVDVRSVEDYSEGHVDGAINIPLDELEERLAELGGKGKKIIVYCNKGISSDNAKRKLIEAGYRDVKNGGGLSDMMAMKRAVSKN